MKIILICPADLERWRSNRIYCFCGLVLGKGVILFDFGGWRKAGRAIFNIDIFSGVN
jgi:hypothetical protein